MTNGMKYLGRLLNLHHNASANLLGILCCFASFPPSFSLQIRTLNRGP